MSDPAVAGYPGIHLLCHPRNFLSEENVRGSTSLVILGIFFLKKISGDPVFGCPVMRQGIHFRSSIETIKIVVLIKKVIVLFRKH